MRSARLTNGMARDRPVPTPTNAPQRHGWDKSCNPAFVARWKEQALEETLLKCPIIKCVCFMDGNRTHHIDGAVIRQQVVAGVKVHHHCLPSNGIEILERTAQKLLASVSRIAGAKGWVDEYYRVDAASTIGMCHVQRRKHVRAHALGSERNEHLIDRHALVRKNYKPKHTDLCDASAIGGLATARRANHKLPKAHAADCRWIFGPIVGLWDVAKANGTPREVRNRSSSTF